MGIWHGPVQGDVTVIEAHLLAGLAHRELGDQRAANQAAEHALALAGQDRVILPFAMTSSARAAGGAAPAPDRARRTARRHPRRPARRIPGGQAAVLVAVGGGAQPGRAPSGPPSWSETATPGGCAGRSPALGTTAPAELTITEATASEDVLLIRATTRIDRYAHGLTRAMHKPACRTKPDQGSSTGRSSATWEQESQIWGSSRSSRRLCDRLKHTARPPGRNRGLLCSQRCGGLLIIARRPA